jgi:hypothetical protein
MLWYRDSLERVGSDKQLMNTILSRTPMGRIGTTSECGRLAVFLASPDSDFIFGQSIYNDGGIGFQAFSTPGYKTVTDEAYELLQGLQAEHELKADNLRNMSVQDIQTFFDNIFLKFKMEFIFEGCLKNIAKKDSARMSIKSPVPLKNLLGPLKEDLGDLIPYGASTTDTQLLSNLAFYRSNRMLHIDDLIGLEDEILVLLPATGG